ncbi:MAG TPA: TerB family tellurite resistance protein [Rhodopila sp.]|nr:TerB family tellurite resistance protein [Rhodopila sp.]
MTRTGSNPPADTGPEMAPFAQELRGALILEALVAACAVISYADARSSLIERWRMLEIIAGDPLLASLPKTALAEDWAMQRQAFAANPTAAREAALRQVARLASDPPTARMVLDACIRIVNADQTAGPAEVKAIQAVAEALKL